jgi:hypothetical protein
MPCPQIMVCLGEPRQMLGRQNVKETCEPLERQLDDNPIYSKYPRGEWRPGECWSEGPGGSQSFKFHGVSGGGSEGDWRPMG